MKFHQILSHNLTMCTISELKRKADLAKKRWNDLQKIRSATELEIVQAYIDYLEIDREYLIAFYTNKLNEKEKNVKKEKKAEEKKEKIHVPTEFNDEFFKSAKLYMPVDNKKLDVSQLEKYLNTIRKDLPHSSALTLMNGHPTIIIQSSKDLNYEDINTSKLAGIPFAIEKCNLKPIAA
jgi:hypothetical protein